jgi:purine-cytosine permease-like protein
MVRFAAAARSAGLGRADPGRGAFIVTLRSRQEPYRVRAGRAPQRITSPSPSGTGGRGDQFTLWFAANANVVNFTLGGLAIDWSAINRVDYYQVKSGRYEARSFFTPDGIYGRIRRWACICYVITPAVQVPFLDQLFYVGPLVSSLGGADSSWIVGFGVASLLYLAGAKRFVRAGPGQGLPAADPVAS